MRKNRFKYLINKNKGLTLVALIITIVVLTTLATIFLSVILGENSILEKSKKASETYLREKLKEQIQYTIYEAKIQEINSLTYDVLCDKYLKPKGYKIENYDGFGKIVSENYKNYEIYIDKNTFELTFEKDYEVCEITLKTDNNINSFKDVLIMIKNSETGEIIEQYKVLEGENKHSFLIPDKTKYTVNVSKLENEVYIYTVPNETEKIESITGNTRKINIEYKEKGIYLYNKGQLNAKVTGGWDNKFKVKNDRYYSGIDPTFNTDNITLSLSKTQGIECIIGTTNKVDLTNYSKIYINYEYDTEPAFSRPLCIFTDKELFPKSYIVQLNNNECAQGVSSIDISEITGSYYIGSGIWNSYSTTPIKNSRIIYQIWIEK